MKFNFDSWLKQPTTVSGIAALSGTAIAAFTQYVTHDPTTSLTVFGLVLGLVKASLPDNSGVAVALAAAASQPQQTIQQTVAAAAGAAATAHMQAAMPAIVAQATQALVAGMMQTTPMPAAAMAQPAPSINVSTPLGNPGISMSGISTPGIPMPGQPG